MNWVKYPFEADHYLETGELLPENALKEMGRHNAIYMGAVCDPTCRLRDQGQACLRIMDQIVRRIPAGPPTDHKLFYQSTDQCSLERWAGEM